MSQIGTFFIIKCPDQEISLLKYWVGPCPGPCHSGLRSPWCGGAVLPRLEQQLVSLCSSFPSLGRLGVSDAARRRIFQVQIYFVSCSAANILGRQQQQQLKQPNKLTHRNTSLIQEKKYKIHFTLLVIGQDYTNCIYLLIVY